MKNYIIALFFIGFLFNSFHAAAQTKNTVSEKTSLENPYKPNNNDKVKIDARIKKAKKENKNIILQAGGNWCSWCLLFNDFIKTNTKVKNELYKNFLYYHLKFSTEN